MKPNDRFMRRIAVFGIGTALALGLSAFAHAADKIVMNVGW